MISPLQLDLLHKLTLTWTFCTLLRETYNSMPTRKADSAMMVICYQSLAVAWSVVVRAALSIATPTRPSHLYIPRCISLPTFNTPAVIPHAELEMHWGRTKEARQCTPCRLLWLKPTPCSSQPPSPGVEALRRQVGTPRRGRLKPKAPGPTLLACQKTEEGGGIEGCEELRV